MWDIFVCFERKTFTYVYEIEEILFVVSGYIL